jgi:hypothetical protein
MSDDTGKAPAMNGEIYAKVWPNGDRFDWALFEANGEPVKGIWEGYAVSVGGTCWTRKRADKKARKEMSWRNAAREIRRRSLIAFEEAPPIT